MGNQNIEDPGDGEKKKWKGKKSVEDPGWPLVPICEYDGSSGYSTQGNLFGGQGGQQTESVFSDCSPPPLLDGCRESEKRQWLI